MSLLPSEEAQYSAIIDGILASGDLNTISAKQIRKGLQATIGRDLSDKKNAIQVLILSRFDHASNQRDLPAPSSETITIAPVSNGYHNVKKEKKERKVKSETPQQSSRGVSTPSPPDNDSDEDISPPKKKRKPTKEVDDEELAKMLQAQENSRARPTRAGVPKKKNTSVVKKKTPRKKSEKKVKADDDSDLEVGSDGEVKEKVRKGGFHKQYHLSTPLADLVGEPTLSRPQVVKKIWAHIKAHNLQDPTDKRQILCDDKMYSVFKQDKVHMFTMNKILGKQLYDVEE